jgi:hypothetical protein
MWYEIVNIVTKAPLHYYVIGFPNLFVSHVKYIGSNNFQMVWTSLFKLSIVVLSIKDNIHQLQLHMQNIQMVVVHF